MMKRLIIQFKNSKSFFRPTLFAVVFLFTFILRAHDYDRVPTAGHLDEQLYALSGLYLIEDRVPVSWSTLDYPKGAEVYRGKISYKGGSPEASVTLYKPWLDEPPLFSLLVGAFAKLYKADKTGFVPSSYIRLPVVLISSVTAIFVYLVAKQVSGFGIGILAMLFYGLTPIFVFASRTAMPENLIALLLMILILLLIKYKKSPKFRYLALIPLMTGVAGLSKPTGFFLLPLSLYYVYESLPPRGKIFKKALKNKKLWYLVLGTAPFVLAYFLYGHYYDWEIFKRILSIQSFRPVGFGNLTWFLISPSFATSILKDGWYVFSLISGLFFIIKPKNGLAKIVPFSLVYWLIVIMFSGGEGDLLSWYRYPLFPLLAISSAWGFEYLYKKADFFMSFIAIGLLLGNRPLLVTSLNHNIKPIVYRLSFSLLILPSLLRTLFKHKYLEVASRLIIVGVFCFGAVYNIVYIYNTFDIICEGMRCPIVPSTFLSRLYFPFFWRFLIINTTP